MGVLKKVLGIVGSPRKQGNTYYLLNNVLQALGKDLQTELIFLRDYQYMPCIGCEKCKKDHRCHIDDGMQEIYPLLEEADALVLGSPVYNYNVTAWMKAFIDRMYCYYNFSSDRKSWNPLIGRNRPVELIAVGEQHEEKYMGFTLEAMKLPMRDLGFNIVGELVVCKQFKAGEVKNDTGAMQQVHKLGLQLQELL